MQIDLPVIPDPEYFSDASVQQYLAAHGHEDPRSLALHHKDKTPFDLKPVLTQIRLRRKAVEKLPEWVSHNCIFAETALEQCSSQLTARWKADKVSRQLSAEVIVDCNSGMGVDTWAFAEKFKKVISIEKFPELQRLGQYNLQKLGIQNVISYPADAIEWLQMHREEEFDIVYADPDRRADGKGKNADLRLSAPSPLTLLEILKGKCQHFLFKLSPAFDPSEAIRIIPEVKEVWIVSVRHECKEILVLTESGYTGDVRFCAAAWMRGVWHEITGIPSFQNEVWRPATYILLPDVAVVLSGLTEVIPLQALSICDRGRLISTDQLPETFPGTCWRLDAYFEGTLHACIKQFKAQYSKAEGEISAKNTGLSVEMLRKKTGIRPGGHLVYYWMKTGNGFVCMVLSPQALPSKGS